MLIESNGFKLNEYQIPPFKLSKGMMIRFWIEIIPESNNDTDGYWGADAIKKLIEKLNPPKSSVKIAPNKVKRDFIDFIKPRTVAVYLKSKFGYTHDEILGLISQFDIKPHYLVKNLGAKHQKLFAILCEFQRSQVVVFDYYGLSPISEERLTKFVQNQLLRGKSAISFDNIHFQPEKPDSNTIINLDIRRKR